MASDELVCSTCGDKCNSLDYCEDCYQCVDCCDCDPCDVCGFNWDMCECDE